MICEPSSKIKGIIKISVHLCKILRSTYYENLTLKSSSILCLIIILKVFSILHKIAKSLEQFT